MDPNTNSLFFSELELEQGLGGLCSAMSEFTAGRNRRLKTWDPFFDQLDRYSIQLERFSEESQPLMYFRPFQSEQDFVASGLDLLATIEGVSEFYGERASLDQPKLAELLSELKAWANASASLLNDHSKSEPHESSPTSYQWAKLEHVATGLKTLNIALRFSDDEVIREFRMHNRLWIEALAQFVPEAPFENYVINTMSVATITDAILTKLKSIHYDLAQVDGFEAIEPVADLLSELELYIVESESVFRQLLWRRIARELEFDS